MRVAIRQRNFKAGIECWLVRNNPIADFLQVEVGLKDFVTTERLRIRKNVIISYLKIVLSLDI